MRCEQDPFDTKVHIGGTEEQGGQVDRNGTCPRCRSGAPLDALPSSYFTNVTHLFFNLILLSKCQVFWQKVPLAGPLRCRPLPPARRVYTCYPVPSRLHHPNLDRLLRRWRSRAAPTHLLPHRWSSRGTAFTATPAKPQHPLCSVHRAVRRPPATSRQVALLHRVLWVRLSDTRVHAGSSRQPAGPDSYKKDAHSSLGSEAIGPLPFIGLLTGRRAFWRGRSTARTVQTANRTHTRPPPPPRRTYLPTVCVFPDSSFRAGTKTDLSHLYLHFTSFHHSPRLKRGPQRNIPRHGRFNNPQGEHKIGTLPLPRAVSTAAKSDIIHVVRPCMASHPGAAPRSPAAPPPVCSRDRSPPTLQPAPLVCCRPVRPRRRRTSIAAERA